MDEFTDMKEIEKEFGPLDLGQDHNGRKTPKSLEQIAFETSLWNPLCKKTLFSNPFEFAQFLKLIETRSLGTREQLEAQRQLKILEQFQKAKTDSAKKMAYKQIDELKRNPEMYKKFVKD